MRSANRPQKFRPATHSPGRIPNPRRPLHRSLQNLLPLYQRQGAHVVAIKMQHIEKIKISRMLGRSLCDFRLARQMKPLLNRAKARLAILVQANNFPIQNRWPRKRSPQRLNHIRVQKILLLIVPARQRQRFPVKPAQNAHAIQLRLENPGRIVKWLGQQLAKHQPGMPRQRRSR